MGQPESKTTYPGGDVPGNQADAPDSVGSAEEQVEAADQRKVPPLMVATWEAAISDPDPLVALGASRALVSLLSTWEAQLVGEATAAGATWEVIGGTVGVSRQAAWERFHDEVHDFRNRIKGEMHELRNRHREEMMEMREKVKSEARVRGRHSH